MRNFHRRDKEDFSERRIKGNFRGKKDFGGKRPFERAERESEGRATFRTICDKCGDTCELPFKPRGGKPVYCSKCFRGVEYGERNKSNASSGELEQINAKLDKILKALKIN